MLHTACTLNIQTNAQVNVKNNTGTETTDWNRKDRNNTQQQQQQQQTRGQGETELAFLLYTDELRNCYSCDKNWLEDRFHSNDWIHDLWKDNADDCHRPNLRRVSPRNWSRGCNSCNDTSSTRDRRFLHFHRTSNGLEGREWPSLPSLSLFHLQV